MSVLVPSSAVATELEEELNGWLNQFTTIPTAVLGAPFTSVADPPFQYRAYRLDAEAYMVVDNHEKQPNHITTPQLTGKASTQMLPFKGLRLGDGREKVLAALGQPSNMVAIDDPKVSRLEYGDRNYSVELDEAGNLYSIRIRADENFMQVPSNHPDPWVGFMDAVRSHDPSRLIGYLRPDVEVYRNGKTLSIQKRFSDFLSRPDPELMDAFFSSESGVHRFASECEYEEVVRLSEGLGVGLAWRFEDSCGLREVVMFPHAGRYLVYEVAFREQARTTARWGKGEDPSPALRSRLRGLR